MILLQVVGFLLFAYMYFATVAVSFAVFFDRDLNDKPLMERKVLGGSALYFAAFVGVLLLLEGGFEKALFFIPSDWGDVDEYGDWTSVRESISFGLGFYGAIVVTLFVGKIDELRKSKKNLK